MSDTRAIFERIERARREPLHVAGIADGNPLVQNDASGGSTHMVTVDDVSCTCPDYEYRSVPVCKHGVYVVLDPNDDVPDDVQHDALQTVREMVSDLDDRVERLEVQHDQLQKLLAERNQPGLELAPDGLDMVSDDNNTTIEDDGGFESMVSDLIE